MIEGTLVKVKNNHFLSRAFENKVGVIVAVGYNKQRADFIVNFDDIANYVFTADEIEEVKWRDLRLRDL